MTTTSPVLICIVASLLIAGCSDQDLNDAESVPQQLDRSSQQSASTTKSSADNQRPPSPAALSSTTANSTGEVASDAAPNFRMLTKESGFHFQRFDDISKQRRILETNGGGVAMFDYDQDGQLDTFWTNGCQLPRKPGDTRTPSAIFRNLGSMTFVECSSNSGLRQLGYSYGCTVGDYNSDGFIDLFVTGLGRDTLWENMGDGTFRDATEQAGLTVPEWGSSAAFADVNADGWLDLFVVNYLDESDDPPTVCRNEAVPDGFEGCSPALFDGVDDRLFLGTGQPQLFDATKQSRIAGHPGKGLGVVVSDFNLAGTPEIYVANDGEANALFTAEELTEVQVDAATTIAVPIYQEQAMLSGVALNELGFAQASMGVVSGDVDSDGLFDLFMTHFFNDSNTLYVNRGELFFDDATRASGVGPMSRMRLGFGTVLIDDDNDGLLDLFVANGHVDDRSWNLSSEPYRMFPQFLRNQSRGKFSDVSVAGGDYFANAWIGRGAAAGDLDRDGRLDLAVSHQLAESVILHNQHPKAGHCITIQSVGIRSNRSGFGLRANTIGGLIRELSGGGSFQSASAPEIAIGIGQDSQTDLTLTWPSGQVDSYSGVTAGHYVAVEGEQIFPVFTSFSTPAIWNTSTEQE